MNALIVTMLKIILAMGVGFLLYKIKILNDTANKALSRLVADVTAPCLIFISIISMDSSQIESAVKLLWIGIIIYIVLAVLAVVIVRLLKIPRESDAIYRAALIFGNVGFMGLPVAESLFGPVGLFYMALLNIHLNLFVFTYGFYLTTRGSGGKYKFTPLRLLNPGIVGVALAGIVFFLKIRLPDIITGPLEFIGSITSPMAMVIIGSSAAAISLKAVFSHKKLYIISFIKLLIFPIAAYYIFKLTLGPTLMTRVLAMYIGMPTAAIVAMFAIAYDSDSDTASSATAMMNVFSLATIPVVYLVTTFL